MANAEDIKQELNDAKVQLEKAEAAVMAFEGDVNRGRQLDTLRTKEREDTITEREERRLDKLEEEKKRLDEKEEEWGKQVRLLQDRFTATQAAGNDFVTRHWGHRIVCTLVCTLVRHSNVIFLLRVRWVYTVANL